MSEQRKRGRPERKIDKGLFDQLCATCNSLSELSRELNVSEKTLRKWISENYSNDFAKLFRERRRKGRLKVKEKDLSLSETTASADDVRKDLMHQLTKRKALSPVFMDLINDYMDFWVIKEQLKKDIRKRGVYVQYDNGGGQTGYTSNSSVDNLLKVSSKMRDIIKQLEISVDVVSTEMEEEDDFL